MSRLAFDKIRAGLDEAIAFTKGELAPGTFRVHIPDAIDVKAIRAKTGMTQAAFAERYGFAIGTLRDWEQRRSAPDKTARALLLVIDREPEAVERALSAA